MSSLPPDPYNANCPSREVLDRIADRWAVLIVGALADGPQRFSQLRQQVGGVSQKMLTRSLRGLERDGLLTRTAYAEVPPRVEYALTDLGFRALVPMRALAVWAGENLVSVQAHQAEYDVDHVRA